MSIYGKGSRRIMRIVKLFSRNIKVQGQENITGPCLFIGRHLNNYGPVAMYLHMPVQFHLWAFDAFMEPKAAYAHLVKYTFTERAHFPLPVAKLFAAVACHPAAWLLNNLGCIPVHRKSRRILETINTTVDTLEKGESVMVLTDKEYQNTSKDVGEIYGGFATIARQYKRRTGKDLSIVPVCVHREIHAMTLGDPLYLNAENTFSEEKEVLIRDVHAALSQSY